MKSSIFNSNIFQVLLVILSLLFLQNSTGQTVTNLNDSGAGSFRQAIEASEATPGDGVISFTSGLSGTIILASDLPVITQN